METILNLLEKDQENIRLYKNGQRALEETELISQKISEEFLNIIRENGLPLKNLVDYKTYKAAITLSLHLAPDDLKIIFKNIERLNESEIELSDKAYFIDRFKIHDKQKQVYGTQFKKEAEKIVFLPIEDETNIDKRRALMGLCSLKQYEDYIMGRRNSLKPD